MQPSPAEKSKDSTQKPDSARFWQRLRLTRLPETLRLDKLRAKLRLSSLSDEKLDVAIKWSRRLGLFAAAHAGLWAGIGAVGAAAIGLRALGIALLPASLGVSTLVIGAVLVAKSVIGNRLCVAVHKRCTGIKKQRAGVAASKTISPTPAPAPPAGKLAGTAPAVASFNPAASTPPAAPTTPAAQPQQVPPWLRP